MRCEQIFETVGLSRDEIVAATTGRRTVATIKPDQQLRPRAQCPICGKRINKRLCVPFKQPPLVERVLVVTPPAAEHIVATFDLAQPNYEQSSNKKE